MTEFLAGATFADFVERRGTDSRDRVFVRLVRRDGRRRTLTFGEMDRRTARLAQTMLRAGVTPGNRVLVLAPNSLEMVVALLAAARCGLVGVPVSTASVPADVAYVARLTEPDVVVVADELVPVLVGADLPDQSVRLAVVVGSGGEGLRAARKVMTWDEAMANGERRGPVALPRPRAPDLFQLLMTSGTTGRPKAVMLSHTTRLRSAYRVAFHARVREDDVLLNPFPASHINCLDSALLPALVTGCTAVLFEAFSASNLWRTVCKEGATVVSVMPTVLRALRAVPASSADRDHRVRLVLGALRPTRAELEEFLERFGIPRYENGYGLTEAGMAVTQTVSDLDRHYPSIGVAMFDRTVELLDESGRPAPVGSTGEIVVSCRPEGGVMDGYWRDPEATARAMGNGWLHTGDLAKRDADGFFYFVGRVKDVIKRSGENVGADEVEGVLREHPAVREAAVVGVPDAYRDEAVMAFVVPEPSAVPPTLEDVRAFCDGRLAGFKVPTHLALVDALPQGVLGKVDKNALRDWAASLSLAETKGAHHG